MSYSSGYEKEKEKGKQRVRAIVNATSSPISVYDDTSGIIVTFEPIPIHQRRRAMAQIGDSAVYVVETTMAHLFRDTGRDMSDMALVQFVSGGRRDKTNPHVIWDGQAFHCIEAESTNHDISRLISARDCQTEIRLYNATIGRRPLSSMNIGA